MTEPFAGYKNILLPIDFSDHCERAGVHGGWIAEKSGAMVHLAHVVANPFDPIYEPDEVQHWVVVEHSEKKARELLKAAAEHCLPAGCPRDYHVFSGDPYAKLLDASKQIGADLVVMATHGTSEIRHLVMGSVADKMARHGGCPVLLVRRD